MDEEDVLLDSYLSSLRLTRKHTPKDGACMFRAVAEHVYHTQALHGVVREECVEYLQEHHKDFAAFICVNGRPYDDYVNKMRKPTTWGGEVELQALSNRYCANFQIYQLGEQVMTIDNGFSKTYQLCFSHGNHYDIVYPESTMDAFSLCQSLVYELIDQALNRSETKSDAPSSPVVSTGASWKYRNLELECWIEESQRREMEDIQLARTLATNGNGAHYSGGQVEDEGDFQRVGRKKHNKTPIVSNTHSFPALKSKAVAPAAPRIEAKAPEARGPSSVEHIFRTVAQEESPWVLKRRQQEEERKRQRELEQQRAADEEQKRQPEQEQHPVAVSTASPAALKRKDKTHKPGVQHHPRSRDTSGRGTRDNTSHTSSSSSPIPPQTVAAVSGSSSLITPSTAPPASKWGAKKDWKRHLESAPSPKSVKDGHRRSSPSLPLSPSSTDSTATANQHRSSLSPREIAAPAALSPPQDAALGPATGRDASSPLASPQSDLISAVPPLSAHSTSSQPTSTSTTPAPTTTTLTWAALVKTKPPNVGKETFSSGRSSSGDGASQSVLTDSPGAQSLINPPELPAADTPLPSQEGIGERSVVHLFARSKQSSAEKEGPSPLSQAQAEEVASSAPQATIDTRQTSLGSGLGSTGHSSPRPLASAAMGEKLVNEPAALDNAASPGFAKYSPSIPPYLEDHDAVPEDKRQVSFSFGAFQQTTAKGGNRTTASKIVEGVDMDDLADLGITFGDFRAASEEDYRPSGTAASPPPTAAAYFSPNGERARQQTTEEEAEKVERLLSENGVSSSQPGIGEASNAASRNTHAEPLNSSANQLPAKKGAQGARHGSAGNSKATAAAGSKVFHGERARGGRSRATNGNNSNHHQASPQRGGSNVGATGSNYFSPGGTHYGVSYSAHQAPYGVPAHTYPHGVASPPPPHNYPPFPPMPLHYPEYPVYYHHPPPPPYEFGPAAGYAYPPYDHVATSTYGMTPHYEGGYNAVYEGYHEGYEYPETPYAPYSAFGPQDVEEGADTEAQAHQ